MRLDPVRLRRAPWTLTVWTVAASLLPVAAAAADFRLGDDVRPTFQAIDLEIDARRTDYSGSVRIDLAVQREVERFRFHSEGLTLSRLELAGAAGRIETRHEAEGADIIRVETDAPLAVGAYTLEIDFTNPFDTQAVSLYRMEKDGLGYAFTQFQADDAREAFPCWDEPIFKIPFQVTLRVPQAHLAITNTPIEKETHEDGWRVVKFRRTKPLPSYLLAVAAGPLETVSMSGLGVPGRLVTVRGQSHLTGLAAQMTPPILKALEKYFERPYPYAKLDFLALPEFWPGAMENAGAVTYADRILLAEPRSASVSQRRRMAQVIAHELAHMWFGDLVTMAWWDDLWLNEAFATWMGDKVVDEVFPQFGTAVAAAQRAQNVLSQDARATTRAIRKPVDSAKDLMDGLGLTYQKGRAVLGMFEQWLGPETFRRGVIDYINEHEWSNAVAADLWRSLDKASGKNVSKAMATFFEQPGFPLIDVEISGARLQLSQQRFRNHGSESADVAWQIPVSLKISNGGAVEEKTVLLDRATLSFDLGGEPPAWVFPNTSAHGYYRWRLPSDALQVLAKSASTALSPRERVELIGNVSALLAAGSIRGDEYLGVLGELADDPDPLVIRSLIDALQSVKLAFVPAELEAAFAGYVRRTLGPAMQRFGLQKAAGEAEAVSLVRPTLYAWLGREGRDAAVLEASRSLATAYMAGAAEVDPALIGVALQLAAIGGDRQLFEEYTRRLESASSPAVRQQFLGAMGFFGDNELQLAALRYSLEGPLRPNEIFVPGRGVANTVAGRDLAYRWLTENYDALMQRLPPMFASFMPFFANGCSADRLANAKVFFADPEHGGEAAAKRLARVAEQVGDCVAMRQREGAAVARYLLEKGS